MMKPIYISLVIVFILIFPDSYCQENSGKNEYTFMFYNTENFFDCENDSLTMDDEFTPDGDRRWNQSRMYAKADRLSKVILAAGKWNPPVFVGLCETENLKVLEFLTKQTSLNKYNYKIIQKDSPDERGIDVAFIYRPDLFYPFDYQAIAIIDPSDKSFRTRDILQISGVLLGCDTVHVFINHWPSRYGGIMETKRLRGLSAEALKKSIRVLYEKYMAPKIICTGDFNDNPKDESLAGVFDAVETDHPDKRGEMINLSFKWLSNKVQTLKNQYSWEVFDQWIVSDYFIKKNNCFVFSKAEIFDAGYLLEPDLNFGGQKPKRTYIGFKYQEGFSDHLPVVLRIQKQIH